MSVQSPVSVQPLQSIDADVLKQWCDRNQVLLVDVREPSEYASTHIPGAISLPLSRLDKTPYPSTDAKALVLYCYTGQRSRQAAQILMDAGVNPVWHLAAGLENWQRLGYPVQAHNQAEISPMRQVQMIAGSLILLGTILGVWVSPAFLLLSGAVGAGLLYAGVSGNCMMVTLLLKLRG